MKGRRGHVTSTPVELTKRIFELTNKSPLDILFVSPIWLCDRLRGFCLYLRSAKEFLYP